MFATRAAVSASRLVGRRGMSAGPVHPGYSKTGPIKEKMLAEDGLPVHIKGGTIDTVLFGLTGAACLIAIGVNLKTYYDFSLK